MIKISLPFNLELNAKDRDFLEKAAVAMATAAGNAAFWVGYDRIIPMLQADPTKALWAAIVIAVVSAIGVRRPVPTAVP